MFAAMAGQLLIVLSKSDLDIGGATRRRVAAMPGYAASCWHLLMSLYNKKNFLNPISWRGSTTSCLQPWWERNQGDGDLDSGRYQNVLFRYVHTNANQTTIILIFYLLKSVAFISR